MEFIKISEDKYRIKDSNNVVVSEEEKLKIERKELILKDITSDECQKENHKKLKKIEKKLDELSNNIIEKTN